MSTITMTKQHLTAAAVLALAGVACGPAHALEDYVTYDNFNGLTQLSTDKWQFPERQRVEKGGVLSMIQRDYGSQVADSGTFNNSWSTSVRNPVPVTQLKGGVKVNAYTATGCAKNTAPSTIDARLVGTFFNVGSTAPTSRIGDVVAVVRLLRPSNSTDPVNTLTVEGVVVQCTTTDCNYDQIELGRVALGTATVGQNVLLELEWDKAKKRFNFQRDAEPVQRVTYTASDTFAPFQNFKAVGTRTNAANCFTGNRTEAYVDASFDKLSVNVSALP